MCDGGMGCYIMMMWDGVLCVMVAWSVTCDSGMGCCM